MLGLVDNSKRCEDRCKGDNSRCFLPVHNRMTWFGAFAHCKRLNGTLYGGHFPTALLCNASRKIETSHFWTGMLYETNVDPRANWTWLNGSVFEEWDKWKIQITDVGCGGCGFWKNGKIYLTSNCSQNFSYLCEDREDPINQRQLSWERARKDCALLMDLNHTTKDIIQKNTSHWLGIYKNNTCKPPIFTGLANITQAKLKCPSVQSSNYTFSACNLKNRAICVKPGPLPKCPNNWNPTTKGSCWRAFHKMKMTWKAAHAFCLQQGSRLVNLTDVRVINKNSSLLSDARRYWTGGAQIKAYFPEDPLHGWYWPNGTLLSASHRWVIHGNLRYTGENERCAVIHRSKNGIYLEDSCCNLRSRLFICKKINQIRDMDKLKFLKRTFVQFKNNKACCRKDNRKIKKKLFQHIKEFIRHAKSSCSQGSFKNTTENETVVVEMNTTTLDRLHEWRENTTSIPIITIRKLCQKQRNCTVKRVEIHLKDIFVNISHLSNLSSLVSSDITVLEYIVKGQLISKLEENETVSLKFSKKLKSITKKQVNCLFFDGDEWNRTGMNVASINGEIECLTNHLSSFTMVVLEGEVSESNKVALKFITYIGSGLSLAGLFITCVVYIVLYEDLQILTTSRHLVHLNLQIALGLTQLVFLAGGSVTNYEIICKVVAILVHYFSLAGFTWILLEAAMLYLKLISVYDGEFVRMKNFLLFGWGFPLLLVGLSAGVKIDAYGTEQWCWLSNKDGFLWVFYAPVIIITSVTLVTVIAVVRVLFIASKSEGADAKKRIVSAARGVVILFPTLGLSWGFSVIAVNHDALVWKYLFAIFTSLQGFLIFLIYGVCNTEIRIAVGRKMGYDVNYASYTT